ncbi:MAG: hypothetical protein C5B50_18315 [Verrucomicrobia bacterium]|nr:MAG: hypothetical protein C5B50_18315 [Verrucomicrobiota bacterium]
MSRCLPALCVLGVCALLLAGCRTAPDEFPGGMSAGLAQAQLPGFLSRPMSILLTNSPGYSAQVTLDSGLGADHGSITTGQLLCRSNKFIFAPDANHEIEKRFRVGSLLFVWDPAESRGMVMSEILQGYAPISFSVHPTNIASSPVMSAPERLDGNACREAATTIATSDGLLSFYHLWQAPDLKNLPLRISTTNAAPLTVTLSKVRFEPPPEKIFEPREGFTRYESAEAMMTELIVRRQKQRSKSSSQLSLPESLYPSGPPPGH